jgi:hypothetical protein
MLRRVWIATHHILHRNGWTEKYIWGVFPSAEVAEANGVAWLEEPYEISRWEDGDVYITGPGEPPSWKMIIQPHRVTYKPPVREKIHA